MLRFLISTLFVFSVYNTFSQQRVGDSLFKNYRSTEDKEKKVRAALDYAKWLKGIDLDSSQKYLVEAYAGAMQLKNEKLQAESALQLANCALQKGNYKTALRYDLLAANIYNKIKDKEGLARTYNSMGIIYWYQGFYQYAIDYFKKNISLSRELGDESGVGSGYGNLAIIFDEKKENDSALYYYNKALPVFIKENNQENVASLYDNMSLTYLRKKDYRNAIDYHRKGMEIRYRIGDSLGVLASLNNQSWMNIEQGKFDEALNAAMKAMRMAERMNAMEDLKVAYHNITKSYSGKKQFKEALEYMGKLTEMKDSLRNSENTRQLAEMEARYKHKERENELNQVKLSQQLKEKEMEGDARRKNYVITTLVLIGISVVILAFFIFRRYKERSLAAIELERKNSAISEQKLIIDNAYKQLEEKNKDITDSIRYAKRIQEAILPPMAEFTKTLPDSFVLFKPKDIVSGDFYWMEQLNGHVYFAVVDCTGHGVPGAFMSIVGFNLLNKAIHENKLTEPAEILDQLNVDLNETLRQTLEESKVKDGMEISLCRWTPSQNKLLFSGANNLLYQISNGRLLVHKGNKHPIGGFYGESLQKFTNVEVEIRSGDRIYLTSDGFADQFGGPKGKKFKYKQLEERLLELHHLPMGEQMAELDRIFTTWRDRLEQVDDVLVMGVRV